MPTQKLVSAYVTKDATAPDPAPLFKFWIEIENVVVAEFKECSGLRVEREVKQHQEGGVNHYVHILPGRIKYSNITLKHGITDPETSKKLWQWFEKGLYDAKVQRINFSILLRNVAGEVIKRWNVIDAFPVKWEGPQLNVESSQVAIETLELAHHGLTLSD